MNEKQLRSALAEIFEPEPGESASIQRMLRRIGKMALEAVDAAFEAENQRCIDICNSVSEPGEMAPGSYYARAIRREGR